jgi:hypothetical protein
MKAIEMDELVFLWESYGKAHDSKLTKDAIELKQNVRKFIASLPVLPGELQNPPIKKCCSFRINHKET